jgi:hypothetical protein
LRGSAFYLEADSMKKLIKFKGEDGADVLVEVDQETEGTVRAGRGDQVAELTQATFEKALAGLRPITDRVRATLSDVNNPAEFSISFGIKLNAEAGAIVASASAEANISVSLKWKNE